MIKPFAALQRGDLVGIIAPAGPAEAQRLALDRLEQVAVMEQRLCRSELALKEARESAFSREQALALRVTPVSPLLATQTSGLEDVGKAH